ncbi:MAG: DUF3467 domain-containing protein [bacterium]|nr:MAG: DUF3467 domain-containing protein [bacterium]
MSEEKRAVIHIDPAEESGRYSNAATVMHSPTEFILDFMMSLPGGRRKVVSRVITSPSHVKQFAMALMENVGKYEAHYGEISVPGEEPKFTGTVN